MKLEEVPTKELLALHNRIADKPAGPKTFATRTKLVARIEQIAAGKNINLAFFGRPKRTERSTRMVLSPEVAPLLSVIRRWRSRTP